MVKSMFGRRTCLFHRITCWLEHMVTCLVPLKRAPRFSLWAPPPGHAGGLPAVLLIERPKGARVDAVGGSAGRKDLEADLAVTTRL